MKTRELLDLGIPNGSSLKLANDAMANAALGGMPRDQLYETIKLLSASPEDYTDHKHFGSLAEAVIRDRANPLLMKQRSEPATYKQWGSDLEPESVQQMENACQLPISVRGALMPDAHLGYGLPIGGVLGTRDAVIPYAVGVDIACRMKLTVLDIPDSTIDNDDEQLINAINRETRFGIGASFRKGRDRRQHAVMDEDWSVSPVTQEFKDKAWKQLGTSGSGNHFVEFGKLKLDTKEFGLEKGTYLALLSHSGSRGTGAAVCNHYSKLARQQSPDLPNHLRHLAWLDLKSHEGQEYWEAMELMGKYAEANHACIHKHVAEHLGAEVLLDIENHHNFAWKEVHDGEEIIVHRKGATPAGEDAIGIIPGSMASATYIVRGLGNSESLNSAAHGAGRVMSRTKAKKSFKWKEVNKYLKERKVKLLSAGLDEVPMVYKDIHEVMNAQADLVEPLAIFQPRLVKMAPAGERPED